MRTRTSNNLHRLLALGLCALLQQSAAWAQDVEQPAGDLPPDEGASSEGSPTDADAAAAGSIGDKSDKATGSKTDDWETYGEGDGDGVAQEITGGVRVEDVVEPPADYRYAAFGKPDPFVPPLIAEEDGPAPNAIEIPIVSPLQKFGLDELSVVGIWQLSSGERKAMVMADQEGIIVKNGDPIGNRGGKILGVGDDYITVREFTLAPDGTRQFEDRQMFMGKKPDDDIAGKIRFKPGAKEPEIILPKPEPVPVDAGAAAAPGFGDGNGSIPGLGAQGVGGAADASNVMKAPALQGPGAALQVLPGGQSPSAPQPAIAVPAAPAPPAGAESSPASGKGPSLF